MCASFFLSFPLSTPPLSKQLSSPQKKNLFLNLWTSFFLREKASCRALVLGTVLDDLAPLEKGNFLSKRRAKRWGVGTLDVWNHAIVITESLARVIAAIRTASVRWRSHLPPNTKVGPSRPCLHCAAVRIARLAFVHAAFVPCGIAEWLLRVD